MSEYQYYEFQAIDRPLTNKEMRELRSYSTRARITPTSFVNEYSWGCFKGDEDAWMEKYFDAFLYLANWGTHILKLRLPSRLLDPKIANEYCCGHGAFVTGTADKVILSFVAEDEQEGGDLVEGEGYLSSMISVRAEMARGDLRALYLGWLLCVQSGELDDEDIEPPVPPGLGQLSASLESMAEFLYIDRDLLHVAAQPSPSLEDSGLERDDVRKWFASLRSEEKDELLTKFVVDGDQAVVNELLHRFHKEGSPGHDAAPPRRTVGELLRAAEASAAERRRIEVEKRAKEKARREREIALARERHLDSLAGREPQLWAEIETLIAAKQPKKYDEAIKLLVGLRDLDDRAKSGDFRMRIEALRQAHARMPTLIERIKKAGL